MRIRLIQTGTLASVLLLGACGMSVSEDRSFPVFFDSDSAILDSPAQDIVVRASDVAKHYPRAAVTLSGYADDPVAPTTKASLAMQRADVVAALLIANGVDAGRVTRVGHGMPPGGDPGLESRRVEIAIDAPNSRL